MVLAAQHVRHAHGRVIDRVAEEERRGAVRAPDHEIADAVRVEALLTVYEIIEKNALVIRHAEAQRRMMPLLLPGGTLRGGESAAGAGIARRLAGTCRALT